MKENNKKCICCGKVYTYCPRCEAVHSLPRWMNMFDNENCKKLFDIASDYVGGVLDKDTALLMLTDCDLSEKDHMNHNIVDAINDILGEEPKKNRKKNIE